MLTVSLPSSLLASTAMKAVFSILENTLSVLTLGEGDFRTLGHHTRLVKMFVRCPGAGISTRARWLVMNLSCL